MKNFIKETVCICIAASVFLTGCAAKTDSTVSAVSKTSASSGVVSASSTAKSTSAYDYAKKALDASYNASAQIINLDEKSGKISITNAGEYIITGTLSDGSIEVDADDDVQLVLDGASITSTSGAAVVSLNGDIIITLADGSENSISSSGLTEAADAAVYASDDLYFNGGGSLTITCTDGDAVAGKDDTAFISGTYNITSDDDGIRGKDALAIYGGSFTINAGGDGLKSTNTEDTGLGCIYIDGGTFDITAGADGVQAETSLYITGGDLKIKSGGGTDNAVQKAADDMRGFGGDMGGGKRGGTAQQIADTSVTTETAEASSAETSSDSFKGLKAGSAVYLSGGNVGINSADDAVHTNGICTVSGGTLTLAAGDDGIHADNTLNIQGGSVTISQSYEGLEAAEINISGGECSVAASDDGINAAGGTDTQGTQFDKFSQSTGSLNISGGSLYVDAYGDGLDANGAIDISGGVITVNGPENNGNGALDYDGSCTISGGTLIAVGASGMAQMPSDCKQPCIMASLSQTQTANTGITITDADGKVLYTLTSAKSFSSIVASTNEMQSGASYTVTAGNTTATVTAR